MQKNYFKKTQYVRNRFMDSDLKETNYKNLHHLSKDDRKETKTYPYPSRKHVSSKSQVSADPRHQHFASNMHQKNSDEKLLDYTVSHNSSPNSSFNRKDAYCILCLTEAESLHGWDTHINSTIHKRNYWLADAVVSSSYITSHSQIKKLPNPGANTEPTYFKHTGIRALMGQHIKEMRKFIVWNDIIENAYRVSLFESYTKSEGSCEMCLHNSIDLFQWVEHMVGHSHARVAVNLIETKGFDFYVKYHGKYALINPSKIELNQHRLFENLVNVWSEVRNIKLNSQSKLIEKTSSQFNEHSPISSGSSNSAKPAKFSTVEYSKKDNSYNSQKRFHGSTYGRDAAPTVKTNKNYNNDETKIKAVSNHGGDIRNVQLKRKSSLGVDSSSVRDEKLQITLKLLSELGESVRLINNINGDVITPGKKYDDNIPSSSSSKVSNMQINSNKNLVKVTKLMRMVGPGRYVEVDEEIEEVKPRDLTITNKDKRVSIKKIDSFSRPLKYVRKNYEMKDVSTQDNMKSNPRKPQLVRTNIENDNSNISSTVRPRGNRFKPVIPNKKVKSVIRGSLQSKMQLSNIKKPAGKVDMKNKMIRSNLITLSNSNVKQFQEKQSKKWIIVDRHEDELIDLLPEDLEIKSDSQQCLQNLADNLLQLVNNYHQMQNFTEKEIYESLSVLEKRIAAELKFMTGSNNLWKTSKVVYVTRDMDQHVVNILARLNPQLMQDVVSQDKRHNHNISDITVILNSLGLSTQTQSKAVYPPKKLYTESSANSSFSGIMNRKTHKFGFKNPQFGFKNPQHGNKTPFKKGFKRVPNYGKNSFS